MYCEIPAFYSEAFHVARKQHVCCECWEKIAPGDKYVACTGLWDGRIETYKQHLPCYHIARFCNLELDLGSGDCIPFGGIYEALGDMCTVDANDTEVQWGVEQMASICGHWEAWLKGIKEKFSCGSGI